MLTGKCFYICGDYIRIPDCLYFGVLKRLEWVEATSETEQSSIQENYSPAPERTYYRLTKKGVEAGDDLWSNPLFTLYPEIGPSHMKKE